MDINNIGMYYFWNFFFFELFCFVNNLKFVFFLRIEIEFVFWRGLDNVLSERWFFGIGVGILEKSGFVILGKSL